MDLQEKDTLFLAKKTRQISGRKDFTLEARTAMQNQRANGGWKVMIVDDDPDVHSVTHLVLDQLTFDGKTIALIDGYSAEEARALLKRETDVAIILLDVVMETHQAGLDLVHIIREDLANPFVRIVLRTGQPGLAPERQVIQSYQIDDYTTKVELTADKLYTIVMTGLRTYAALMTIEHYRQTLEEQVQERTRELQSRNEELKRLNDEKNQFLGIVSHDLKNPLTGIRSLAMAAVDYGPEDFIAGEAQNFFRLIIGSCDRMFMLIENLLDINRLESGRQIFNLTVFDLRFKVSDVIMRYEKAAAEKSIFIQQTLPNTFCWIKADAHALEQVFDNLISNALKFSPPDKKIWVSLTCRHAAESATDFVRCEIRDEGQGLTENDKTHLFGKFTRLSAIPTAGEHSTGLGLSIVKNLVDAMGGQVWAESPGKDQGSSFFVEFPQAAGSKNIEHK